MILCVRLFQFTPDESTTRSSRFSFGTSKPSHRRAMCTPGPRELSRPPMITSSDPVVDGFLIHSHLASPPGLISDEVASLIVLILTMGYPVFPSSRIPTPVCGRGLTRSLLKGESLRRRSIGRVETPSTSRHPLLSLTGCPSTPNSTTIGEATLRLRATVSETVTPSRHPFNNPPPPPPRHRNTICTYPTRSTMRSSGPC
jgi:hypothetical protein